MFEKGVSVLFNQKLLVIGAGIGQTEIIKKAKARGIHVTVVTLPGNQPGIELSDDVFYCDIYDRDKIVTWAKQHGITAVVSDQNDLMNPTVAYVSEKLGLPGNSFNQVMSYCDKNVYRNICDIIGNPTPIHSAVYSSDFVGLDCPFPWIVKPADSQSSVGVRKIDSKDELKPALETALCCSKTHSAIIEEFFEGKEVVCEGFIENGEYYLLSFADRKYFALHDLFIPSQTIFPSTINSELLNKILECERKIASYVKPSFGIVHSEYLVNEKKNIICVVESALRGGGVYISSDLIPLATGIDVTGLLLDKAMGCSVDIESQFGKRIDAASGYVCFYLPEGKIVSVSGVEKIKQFPFVKKVCLDNIQIGQNTEPMLHKGLRKGPILVSGKDRNDIESNIRIIQDTLKIEVQGFDESIKGIVWN